ncbi:MAG: DUF1152 domain-containing protein [Pyrodictiaceae archaeon]
MGGGGDIASTLILGELLRMEGVRTVYSSIVWERFIRDPTPGPISLEELRGVENLAYAAIALPGCYALREYSGVIVPAICRFTSFLKEPAIALDASRGELGVRLGLEEVLSLFDCDTIIGVDVGGDVLAKGFEDEVWSPLADSITLSAIANTTATNKLIVVHSPGADGELPQDKILDYVSEVASLGGYKAIIGLPSSLLGLLEEATTAIYTEAGRLAVLAAKGFKGQKNIRGGSRRVSVNIYTASSIVLDALVLYTRSKLAQSVKGTSSIAEASKRLNELGVYTEYDLELDLLGAPWARENPDMLTRLRQARRRELQKYR